MGCKIITLALPNLCFRNENCNKLTDYIKSLPTYKCPRAKSGGQFLELPTVKRIEKIVDRLAKSKFKHQTVTVKPGLIYKVMSLLQKSRVLIACHSKENVHNPLQIFVVISQTAFVSRSVVLFMYLLKLF